MDRELKIFPCRYVPLIYNSISLEELLKGLSSWFEEMIYPTSPLLSKIASYFLRNIGGAWAPRSIKLLIAKEIFRCTGREDLVAALKLSFLEAYTSWREDLGTDLPNWLSWRIPYIMKRWVFVRDVKLLDSSLVYDIDYTKL